MYPIHQALQNQTLNLIEAVHYELKKEIIFEIALKIFVILIYNTQNDADNIEDLKNCNN